ncbi:UNVERIFIED_CONTAM: Calmodulin-binding transcription activator 3 [Sesamum calycinum]|uniref:Calmodulin-binding transcription activator 3 n=1 Tax=Sesamum calycinum TaxID=2727403 RepID=A0AAW2KKI1_9LAMI
MRTENAHILQDYEVMVSNFVKENEEGNVHILQDFEVMVSKVLKDNEEGKCTYPPRFRHEGVKSSKDEGGTGPNVLDEGDQGLLHFAAALGYLVHTLTIAAGVNVNFRDANGWTALLCAAYYGRKLTLAFAISLGAASEALTDPFPNILLEDFLQNLQPTMDTRHRWLSLTGYGDLPHGVTMKGSLAIVRNAMQPKLQLAFEFSGMDMKQILQLEKQKRLSVNRTMHNKIQAVYDKVVNNHEVDRPRSFVGQYDGGKGPNVLDLGGQGVLHFVAALGYDWAIPPTIAAWRQLKEYMDGESGMSDERAHSLLALKTKKAGQHDQSLDAAAVIRHQVRKKELQKDNLIRRNFRQDQTKVVVERKKEQTEDRLQKAVARLKSIVHYLEARDEYCKWLSCVSEMQETKAVYVKVSNNCEVDCDVDLIDLEALLDGDTLVQTSS